MDFESPFRLNGLGGDRGGLKCVEDLSDGANEKPARFQNGDRSALAACDQSIVFEFFHRWSSLSK
jgi:hypothetical protein